jgi:hypothetical protein
MEVDVPAQMPFVENVESDSKSESQDLVSDFGSGSL